MVRVGLIPIFPAKNKGRPGIPLSRTSFPSRRENRDQRAISSLEAAAATTGESRQTLTFRPPGCPFQARSLAAPCLLVRTTGRLGVHLLAIPRARPPSRPFPAAPSLALRATYRPGVHLHATSRMQTARFSPTPRHSAPPHPVAEPRLHPPRRATPSEN